VVDLAAIERLAPDQASLKAGTGLAKPAKWSNAGISQDQGLIWGECAGSGANPYRVMADLNDLGNKCTCPSRKFPCKHVIGLLCLKAKETIPFAPADTPAWVSEWVSRRRPSSSRPQAGKEGGGPKDIGAAALPEAEKVEDPKAIAKRQAAAAKRLAATDGTIREALESLEQWTLDQLRQGLSGSMEELTSRCRKIAARLVDGKAQTLAGRIDELPARVLELPGGDRQRGLICELARLILLARAFSANPCDPEIRRAVATSETKETVLNDPAALRVSATWEVLAERILTRRDSLISQTVWLLRLDDGATDSAPAPRFAMLLDFFPASVGRRGSAFTPGDRFTGEVAFYSGSNPLRALLLGHQAIPEGAATASPWPEPRSLTEVISEARQAEPWILDIPVLLPPGRLASDPSGASWWRPLREAESTSQADIALPLVSRGKGLIRGTTLERAAALWSMGRLDILAAQTAWGRLDG